MELTYAGLHNNYSLFKYLLPSRTLNADSEWVSMNFLTDVGFDFEYSLKTHPITF